MHGRLLFTCDQGNLFNQFLVRGDPAGIGMFEARDGRPAKDFAGVERIKTLHCDPWPVNTNEVERVGMAAATR